MRFKSIYTQDFGMMLVTGCGEGKKDDSAFAKADTPMAFDHVVEQFANVKILRYQILGFEN